MIFLFLPVVAWGQGEMPTLQVEGVERGDMIGLYLDEDCSHGVGLTIAYRDGVAEVTVNEALPVGEYTFYVSVWRKWVTSPCSEAGPPYRVLPLPPSQLRVVRPDGPELLVSGVERGDWVTLYRDSRCMEEIGSATSEGAEVEIMAGDLPLGEHRFHARTERNGIRSHCSSAHAHHKHLPAAPHSLSVPEGLRGRNPTPIIRMEGVQQGDIVKVYTDSDCTQHRGTATAWDGDVAVISRPLPPGSHRFHAQVLRDGWTSACSADYTDYEVLRDS